MDLIKNCKQLGLKTGEAKDFKSYDELWDAFQKQLKYIIDIKIRGNNVIEKLYAENMRHLVCQLLQMTV